MRINYVYHINNKLVFVPMFVVTLLFCPSFVFCLNLDNDISFILPKNNRLSKIMIMILGIGNNNKIILPKAKYIFSFLSSSSSSLLYARLIFFR